MPGRNGDFQCRFCGGSGKYSYSDGVYYNKTNETCGKCHGTKVDPYLVWVNGELENKLSAQEVTNG